MPHVWWFGHKRVFRQSYELNVQKKEALKKMRMSDLLRRDEAEDLLDAELEGLTAQHTRRPGTSAAASVTTAEMA